MYFYDLEGSKERRKTETNKKNQIEEAVSKLNVSTQNRLKTNTQQQIVKDVIAKQPRNRENVAVKTKTLNYGGGRK